MTYMHTALTCLHVGVCSACFINENAIHLFLDNNRDLSNYLPPASNEETESQRG